jgi:hypothetical protein
MQTGVYTVHSVSLSHLEHTWMVLLKSRFMKLSA